MLESRKKGKKKASRSPGQCVKVSLMCEMCHTRSTHCCNNWKSVPINYFDPQHKPTAQAPLTLLGMIAKLSISAQRPASK